ncbi:hypothetical protein BB558_007436 [Smittium angustum]|uniref:Mitochondrial import receptor subunit TOM22 n=1 Tax=Smittium angustum TaxID=133377 RepID=A0A2U1IV20_SMIAN|nr:hypothetical protein BB558_007436 [Smittium angustum]
MVEIKELAEGANVDSDFDVIPSSTRTRVSNFTSNIISSTQALYNISGKLAWFLSTTALLVVFPLALESDKEQVMIQYEKEQQMMQQQASAIPGISPSGLPMPGVSN